LIALKIKKCITSFKKESGVGRNFYQLSDINGHFTMVPLLTRHLEITKLSSNHLANFSSINLKYYSLYVLLYVII